MGETEEEDGIGTDGRAAGFRKVYRRRSRSSRHLLRESPTGGEGLADGIDPYAEAGVSAAVAEVGEAEAEEDNVVAEVGEDVVEEEDLVAEGGAEEDNIVAEVGEDVVEEEDLVAEVGEVVAEEGSSVGGGADIIGRFDGEFVPSQNGSSGDESFDFRIVDDNDIREEVIRMPTDNSTAVRGADDVNLFMGHPFNVESDYEDSDNLHEVADGSEDEVDDALRFNKRTDMEDPKFTVGMVFESFEVLKHAIRTYSIKRRHPVTINKNDKLRVRAQCGDGCPWMLYAAPYRVGRGGVQIRTLVDEHNCVRGFTNKLCTSIDL